MVNVIIPQTKDSPTVARCLAHLAEFTNAISGSGGHDTTLAAAVAICGFGLSGAEEAFCLDWFNRVKCKPEWSAKELAHKLEDARRLKAQGGRVATATPRRRGKSFEPKPIPKFAPVLPPAESAPVVVVPKPVFTVASVTEWDGAVITWNDLADFKAAHGLRQGEYTITPVWVPALNQEVTYGK